MRAGIGYSLFALGLLVSVKVCAYDVCFEEVAAIQLQKAVGQIAFFNNALLVVHGKCIYLYPLGTKNCERVLCFGDDSGEVSVRESVRLTQSGDNKYVAVSDKGKMYFAKWGERSTLDIMDEFVVGQGGSCQFDKHSKHLLTKVDSKPPGLQVRKIQDDGKLSDCLWLIKQEGKFGFSKVRQQSDILKSTAFKNEEAVDDIFISEDASAFAVSTRSELNKKQFIHVLYQDIIGEGFLALIASA